MSRATAARRLAAAAALGTGGLSALGASLFAVLRLEAVLARWRIGDALGDPPDPTGRYRDGEGDPIRLAVLGDSAAAGYGSSSSQETFGAHLAEGLALLTGRPVALTARAVVGAQSSDLAGQVAAVFGDAPTGRPDVVAVVIGVNDVTHRIRPAASVDALRLAVRSVRSAGAQIVVGTCPDLGTVRPIVPPLRQIARRWSRRLAAAQTIAVVEEGGWSVSLGQLLGPHFDREPTLMFGPDRFHPSPAGYRAAALAMLPSVADALGMLPEDGAEPEQLRSQAVFGLARAAAAAAERPGTEVSPTTSRPAAGEPARRRRRLLARVRSARMGRDTPRHDMNPPERVVSHAQIGQAQGTDAPATGR